MKKAGRHTALLAAALMTAGILAGCGKAKEPVAAEPETAADVSADEGYEDDAVDYEDTDIEDDADIEGNKSLLNCLIKVPGDFSGSLLWFWARKPHPKPYAGRPTGLRLMIYKDQCSEYVTIM